MAKKRKIYEKDFRYDLLHAYTGVCIRLFFKKIECLGRENLPEDGAVILAPNHCNALLDPLAILSTFKGRMVFVARADIFGGALAKIFEFLKMMPINRRRDGIRNMVKAEETIEKSIEVLGNGVPFCILPEGTHRTMHSLLPIGKGIARVAAGFCEKYPGKKVYIVPVGLEYGDYFRPCTTLTVRYGDPVDVVEVLAEERGRTPLEKMSDIRSLTGGGIRKEIVYIPDDEEYEPTWELVKIYSGKVPECRTALRSDAGMAAAAKVEDFREKNPDKAAELLAGAGRFRECRRKAGISLHSLACRHPGGSAVLKTLLATVLLPYVAVCAAAAIIPLGLAEYLCVTKFEDRAFHNSARFLIMEIVWTVCFVPGAVAAAVVNRWAGLLWIAALWPAPYVVYRYAEMVRRTVSLWRVLRHKEIRGWYRNLRDIMEKI